MTYYKHIDGLRCVAIGAVIVHHFAVIFSTYIDWGYFGVDLFFVISGFLITGILLRTKGSFKKSYGNFLGRRTLRIFPLYYFVLFILYLIGQPVVQKEIGYLATYTFNYRYPFIDVVNPVDHFWSLGVEEQFYLFWPVLVLGLRSHLRTLQALILVMITFAFLQISYNIIPALGPYNYVGLPTRMGSLGLGAVGAVLYLKPSQLVIYILENPLLEKLMLVLLPIALIFFIPFLMGVISLFFVMKAAHDSFHISYISRFLSHPMTLYIGRISYGLYVYHIIINYYATPYLFDPLWHQIPFQDWGSWSVLQYHSWVIKLPLYSVITIGVAELSYRYFEKPLLGLKDRFFKRSLVKQ